MRNNIHKCLAFMLTAMLLCGCSDSNIMQSYSSVPTNKETFVIKLYTIDPNSIDDKIDTVILIDIDEKPNPQIIANTYRDMFFNPQNDREGIPKLTWNSITKDEMAMVTIDFTEDGRSRVSAGSFLELTTLGGLAKSIILGDPSVNSVAYSVNGEKYTSGHFEFDLGIPYTTRKHLKNRSGRY